MITRQVLSRAFFAALFLVASTASAGEVLGKITAHRGKTLKVALDGDGPAAGTEARLYKRFETRLGSMKASGWLEIARVSVNRGGPLTRLSVLQKKGNIKVNGKPVNHFKVGTAVKLTWE